MCSRLRQLCARRNVRGAFSLVELLVVVAIIAVLAGVLFPVFSRARENARRASCQSNLKQIGLGLMMYQEDWNGFFPNSFFGDLSGTDPQPYGPSGTLHRSKWMDEVQTHIKSEAVFTCPSHALPSVVDGTTYDVFRARTGTSYGSYAFNSAYRTLASPDIRTPPCSKWDRGYGVMGTQVVVPAQTVWVVDGNGRYEISWRDDESPQVSSSFPRTLGAPGTTDQIVERHLDTTGVLFCDGHVKSLGLNALAETNAQGTLRLFTVQDD